jgi:PleD family two-component response regulator
MGFAPPSGYLISKARWAAYPTHPPRHPGDDNAARGHGSVMKRVISEVRSWFRSSSRGRDQVPALIPVLLASGREDDYQTLQALLQDTKWSVERALSWNEVSHFCEGAVSPVVLVDRHFQGAHWQSTVASILDPAASTCVILISDVSDPYLWNELVQQGGFDVLARPFERSELLQTLAFAHRHSTADWPSLHLPRQHRRLARRKA